MDNNEKGRPASHRTTLTNSICTPTVDEQEAGTSRLLVGALAYVARGWPVFPCQPGGKAPLTGHGFKDATTDPTVITDWWTRWPEANVGLPTGTVAGTVTVDVVDVDVRPDGDGWTAHNRLKRAGLLAGVVTIVRTPSGGLHLYFPGTAQPCGTLSGQYLDFKATGGYVLAPPSVVGSERYVVLDSREDSAGSQVSWNQVRQLLAPDFQAGPHRAARPGPFGPVTGGRSVAGLVRAVADAAEGTRNRMLFWAACRAITEGHHDSLEDLVQAALTAGLGEREARRTVASAARRVGGLGIGSVA